MQKVTAAYFSLVGLFIATGLMVQASTWNAHHHGTAEASVLEVWHEQVAIPSNLQTGWQNHLDNLHW